MNTTRLFPVVVLILLNISCSRLQGPPQASPSDIKTSAFMGSDASLLRPGNPDRGEYATLVYNAQNVNFNRYKQVIIDPVAVYGRPNDNYDGMSRSEIQALANVFYAVLKEEVGKDYVIVDKPAPWTIRIQAALTRAEESKPGLDFVSTVVPFGRAIAEAQNLIVGRTAFVGNAAIEAKLTDALSGDLLSAAVDQRYGQKRIEKGFDSKADVKYLFEYWAKALRYRLCVKSGRIGCEAP